MRRALALGLALVSLGCDERGALPASGGDDAATGPTGPAPDFADVFGPRPDPATLPMLDAPALLTRLSLDLRGVRPTPEERARVELGGADADAALDALVDEMMADARFGDRVRDLFATILRTRVEDFPVGAAALGLDEADQGALFASIGEEALHVVARVATEDRPWTELVTADWTMADATLEAIYPLAREAGPDAAWRPARYTDGRPAAGLLTTNGLWWRYLSDGVSYGRGRANAIARIFLCADFLDRPVDFPRDIDLTDEQGIRRAVRDNDGCIGCHAGLDPLASYLAGFQYTDKTAAEMLTYHPERERAWGAMTELAPAFYGAPGYTLRDLGRQIAADPRFVQCAVETTFELLLRRDVDWTDAREVDALTRHREAFLAGGLTLRSLVRSIVSDPRYRMAETSDGAGAERLVTPEQWADVLAAWTGYRMEVGGADLLATDLTGLRTLAGGGDGRSGSEPAALPTATMSLVWERTAEAAARFAVSSPAAPPEARALFELAVAAAPDGDAAFDDPAFRAQAAALHRRLFGTRVAADGPEVRATLALWDRLNQIDGPEDAWAGVLTALFRDPSLALY
ncbi:MAG: DUF1592 domain-containing protein [Deltaproteobacteria bacterium]|nr:DUF1592 domain-containing protein [Deltaproteobacteria bacterium]